MGVRGEKVDGVEWGGCAALSEDEAVKTDGCSVMWAFHESLRRGSCPLGHGER